MKSTQDGSDMTSGLPPTRVAIHEIGHGATFFLLYGQSEDIYVYKNEDGEYCGQQPPPHVSPLGRALQSRDEWRDVITWSFGGWAAVHLAIEMGLLPFADEASPGDIGFVGEFPADQGCIECWAAQSGVNDSKSLISEGREAALGMLRPHMDKLWSLTQSAVDMGLVEGTDIAEACR